VLIHWLREAIFCALARRLGLTWVEMDGMMARAVARRFERRGETSSKRAGLDATPFQKPYEWVTVLSDLVGRRLLTVLDGRTKESADAHFSAQAAHQRESAEVEAMDLWRPYVDVAARWLPNAAVCCGRVHVPKHLGEAVNTVCNEEGRRLRTEGDRTLVGTKYLWLESPGSMLPARSSLLAQLKGGCARTGRTRALKRSASRLSNDISVGWARQAWLACAALASRSKLEPMARATLIVRKHLDGILNAVVPSATNAAAESMNTRIQRIKAMASG
jgi:transposase